MCKCRMTEWGLLEYHGDAGSVNADTVEEFLQIPPVPQEFLDFNEAAYKAMRSSEGSFDAIAEHLKGSMSIADIADEVFKEK